MEKNFFWRRVLLGDRQNKCWTLLVPLLHIFNISLTTCGYTLLSIPYLYTLVTCFFKFQILRYSRYSRKLNFIPTKFLTSWYELAGSCLDLQASRHFHAKQKPPFAVVLRSTYFEKRKTYRKIHVIGFFFISCRPVTYLLRTRMFLYEFCIKLLKQYLLGGPQRAVSESLSGPDNFPTRG